MFTKVVEDELVVAISAAVSDGLGTRLVSTAEESISVVLTTGVGVSTKLDSATEEGASVELGSTVGVDTKLISTDETTISVLLSAVEEEAVSVEQGTSHTAESPCNWQTVPMAQDVKM